MKLTLHQQAVIDYLSQDAMFVTHKMYIIRKVYPGFTQPNITTHSTLKSLEKKGLITYERTIQGIYYVTLVKQAPIQPVPIEYTQQQQNTADNLIANYTYRELQKLAKVYAVKGNQSTKQLAFAIAAHLPTN